MTIVLLLAGVVAAAIGVLVLTTGSPRVLVIGLVLLRAVCDLGAQTAVMPWSGGLMAVGLAVLAWFVVVLRFPEEFLRPGWVGVLIITALVYGVGIRWIEWDLTFNSIAFAVSLSAIVPIWIVSRLAAIDDRDGKYVGLCAVLPAAFLITSFALLPSLAADPVTGRAAGSFAHPNAAGSYLAVSSVFLLWYFLSGPSWKRGSGLLLGICSIFLTGSLNAAVTCALGCLVLLLIFPARPGYSRWQSIFFLAIGAGWLLFTTPVYARVIGALDSNLDSALLTGRSANSFEWRVINWAELLEMLRGHYVFGLGLGVTSEDVMPLGGPPHSAYVQSLVELGVFGTAVLLLCVFLRVAGYFRGLSTSSAWRIRAASALGIALFTSLLINGVAANLPMTGGVLFFSALAVGYVSGEVDVDLSNDGIVVDGVTESCDNRGRRV